VNKVTVLFLSCLLGACSADKDESTQVTESGSAVETITSSNSPQGQSYTVDYPVTESGDVVDTYFGVDVADPYRWLEDDRSEETGEWVKLQNTVTFDYLAKIPHRTRLKERLEELWNYEKVSAPFTEGDYTYFYKNDGLQDQYVVYRQKGDGEAEVFLDPNKFSDDGTTSLAQLSFSKDGSIAAYSISEGGSDWRKIRIIDVVSGQQLEQPLVDVKFSGISWKGQDGFYYSSYDKPEGSELSAKTDQHKLYYHKLGQPQADDELVFGGVDAQKRRYISGVVTEDDRYLLISGAISTSGNDLFLKDLSQPDSELITILDHTDSDTSLVDNVGSKLFLQTNLNAPNQKVITVDVSQPTPENWVDLILETENVLNPSAGGGYFFAEYMVDAVSRVFQYERWIRPSMIHSTPTRPHLAFMHSTWKQVSRLFIANPVRKLTAMSMSLNRCSISQKTAPEYQ
jgi:prolyl oligopeptidase